MDNKVILIIVAIVAVIACLMIFTPMKEEISNDNVVELDGITFNTINSKDFVKTTERNDSSYQMAYYTSENGTGNAYVNILNFSDSSLKDRILNAHQNFPSESINGVTVYTESESTGEDINEIMYVSIVQGDRIVIVGTPDASETAKIASTMKFN